MCLDHHRRYNKKDLLQVNRQCQIKQVKNSTIKGEIKMKLTRIDIYETKGTSNIKATVNITIDDKIVIKNFKVVEGKKSLFIANPSIKGADTKYYNTCYILDETARSIIYNKILDEYNKKFAKTSLDEV